MELVLIQHLQRGAFDGAFVVMQTAAERFVAVQFVVRHRQVCVADAVLIGEAGQRAVQFLRTAVVSCLDLDGPGFRLLLAERLDQLD